MADLPWRVSRATLIRRASIFGAVLLLVVGFLMWVGDWQAPFEPDAPASVGSVPGVDFSAADADLPEDQVGGNELSGDQTVAFPALGSAEVDLEAGITTEVDQFGLAISPIGTADVPGSIRIRLLETSARDGLQWIVERTDGSDEPGSVEIEFDYDDYRGAGGADWDDRLIVRAADGTEIDSDNNGVAGTLTTRIDLDRTFSGGNYFGPGGSGALRPATLRLQRPSR
ncbi:hypothetical protein GCM10029992_56700 [Glycomyces albus]